MSRWLYRTGSLAPVIVFLLSGLALLTLSRAVLSLAYSERLGAVEHAWWLFPIGARMDVITLCIAALIPALALLMLPQRGARWWRPVIAAWFTLVMLVLVFMEIATGPFLAQYDTRPNRLFFEYLNYPREVFATVWAGYKAHVIIAIVALAATGYYGWRMFARLLIAADPWPYRKRLVVLPLVLIALVLGGRSSLGVRPANISTAAFSTDHLSNELALNSTYSLIHALNDKKNERDAHALYGSLPRDEAIARVQRHSLIPAAQFTSTELPTLHHQTSLVPRARPHNIVIFLQESLGAEYVGSLGGLPLTPNLDRLSREGLYFTNLYATGTRTARGIEAVTADFLPTPSTSVVKLALARHNFFTIAELLRRHRYATEFIYGGASTFDDMRAFFLGNGFERVIDEHDFTHPVFRGTWGVSDEDLARRANAEFRSHGDRPFFALMLSVSNHEPFEFPPGRIELHERPANSVNNAIKYADYAIGEFFRLARQEEYFRNTIFLVVADHDTRVWGADLVPIEKFHIPALILGPGVPARRYDTLASQLDLLPTVLDLAGISSDHPMIGRDLLAQPDAAPGHAIMQYMDTHAFRVGERVLIHRPHLAPLQFAWHDGKLLPTALDPEFERDAMAHIELPGLLYNEQRYRLPGIQN